MSGEQDPPEVIERVSHGLELVEIVARQVGRAINYSVELDDLMSHGHLGLLEAARRFDPSRGVTFKSYANYRVRGAIIDGLRRDGASPRRSSRRLHALEVAVELGEGKLDELVATTPAPTPEQADQSLAEHLASMATALALGLVAESTSDDPGEPFSASTSTDPEQAVARAEVRALITHELDALEPEEATLLRRHYFEGELLEEVAAGLGLSKSWASRLHARALTKLTKRLRLAL